jgi:pseudaminic acid synthase
MTLRISGREIGRGAPPFVIAEMSGNHNQSIERAFEIIDAAALAGADAIKLQTYTADTLTLNTRSDDFLISDKKSLWADQNLHDLYAKAHTPWAWHQELFDYARSRKIICFSSPFDETAVDFLEEIGAPAYKIASFENNHLPLIAKAASTGKPLIISTGMASLNELEEAVSTARNNGCQELALLKCTSSYPASPADFHLKTIPHLSEMFGCEVGLSDHSKGLGASLAGIALGATIVERHFTLSRADGGVDSEFSLEPNEFSSLVSEAKTVWEAIGRVHYGRTESEKSNQVFRRSIYVAADISPGDTFSDKNIRIIRPGYGAPPSLYSMILGKCARRYFKKGEPLRLVDIIS